MSFRAVDHSVNVIAYSKNDINYAMTCAWMMMVDYDKVICLIGSQSVTGKNIEKNDVIGVCSLSTEQKGIAVLLGDNHSDELDKLKDIDFYKEKSAILIPNSKTEMVCEVIDVIHLKDIEEDYLVYMHILNHKVNDNLKHLHMEDF